MNTTRSHFPRLILLLFTLPLAAWAAPGTGDAASRPCSPIPVAAATSGREATSDLAFVQRGVAVLTYHHFITDAEAAAHPERLDDMTMSARQLAAQLDWLRERGAHTLTAQDLLLVIAGQRQAPPHSVAIVIDDGYASVYEIAWPALRARSMKFTVAPIVMATETPAAWQHQFPGALPHLTWEQIAKMLRPVDVDGHPTCLLDLASHTFNKHVLNAQIEHSLPPDQRQAYRRSLQADLFLARTTIDHRTLGLCVAPTLVWPHEDASDTLVEVARQAGHQATFWGAGHLIGSGSDPMRIGRFPAGSGKLTLSEFTHELDASGWSEQVNF